VTTTAPAEPHLPLRAPLEAYGNGGFRFAEMSHRGSLLCLPSGMWAWPPATPVEIDVAALARVIAEGDAIEFLLLGTGTDLVPPDPAVRAALSAAGVRVEPMATGAAARTYNVLLAENRAVAAALLAVE
jgi:uncharacterized protein